MPAAKLGLGYGYEGITRLVNVVGPTFAKEIFFTARRFTSAEAKDMGLVNRVVPNVQVKTVAEETAQMIAENAPMTVDSVKYIVSQIMAPENKTNREECARRVQACFESEDYKEGRKAFMEKRKPNFVGA